MNARRGAIMGGAWLMGLALVVAAWGATEEAWTAPSRASRKANPVAVDDQSLATGKALYAKHCLSCHGATGLGNGPAAKDLEKSPGDLSKPKMWEQTDGAIFWKITTGKKPMPSFEALTTEQERWQIVNYMRTLAPKPADATSQPSGEKR
jgi:mono/diheme cytochrome c family protein